MTVASFDERELDRDIAAGHLSGTYGIVIDATIDGQPFGLERLAPSPSAVLAIEVRAAPWIPVSEVRIITAGRVAKVIDLAGKAELDPFGTGGLVRWAGEVALAEVAPGPGDTWLLVEAGMALPAAADLDDDGVVETTDNDGDGLVDLRDVEEGEESGPLTDPPDPTFEDDPRFHLTAVAPGTWPVAFTNPWLLDLDRDGRWEAPGL